MNTIVDPAAVPPGDYAASLVFIDSIEASVSQTAIDVTLTIHQIPTKAILTGTAMVRFER